MDGPATHLIEKLSRAECLELLQFGSRVGRIAFLLDGHPMVMPVNYLAEQDSIVFCTGRGTKLAAVRHGADVAFEVDDIHPLEHSGWSVVVQGTASEITDPEELDVLRRGPLRSWSVSPDQHWVRVWIGEISGRRIPQH